MSYLPPARRLRRRERSRRRRFVSAALVILLLMAAALLQLSRSPMAMAAMASVEPEPPLLLVTRPLGPRARPVVPAEWFPYSVIPGGAPTVDALARAIATDPVVRAHYAGFNLAVTYLVVLEAPQLVHVSYRLGDEIRWTRRPVWLKAGETLLTDGRHYARTRGGNQLATSPGTVSDREPSAEALDTPSRKADGAPARPERMSW